jgi:hypothetical protein
LRTVESLSTALGGGSIGASMPYRAPIRPVICAGLLLLIAAPSAGCPGSDEATPSLIQQAQSRKANQAAGGAKGSLKEARARGYVKREGLHIDLPYFGGRYFADIPASVVEDQLGEVMIREELPGDEDHIVCARAEVWLHEGRIYRLRKRLAHPMDLPTALGTSGFPLNIGRPIDATRELRWNRVFGMRRVQVFKNEEDPRLLDAIEVHRFIPRELR